MLWNKKIHYIIYIMDDVSNIVTLQLSDYNEYSSQRLSTLRYDGGDLLDYQTKMWVNKFTLNTQAFPLHVPKLSESWSPFYPSGASTANTIIAPLPNNNYYFTNWVITIKAGSQYHTVPVRWENIGYKQPLPVNLDNDYFWVKSAAFLCDIVTSALNELFPDSFYFMKSGSNWFVATKREFYNANPDITFYFNDEMRKFFNFNYMQDNGFIVRPIMSKAINSIEYIMTQTDSTNNFLFPFDRLILTANNLPVPPMYVQNSGSNVINGNKNVILSYDMNIPDISMLGNTISFTTISSDRSLSLMGTDTVKLVPFTIDASLVMRDGTEFRIRLNKGDKLSMEINFF